MDQNNYNISVDDNIVKSFDILATIKVVWESYIIIL